MTHVETLMVGRVLSHPIAFETLFTTSARFLPPRGNEGAFFCSLSLIGSARSFNEMP